MCSSDLADTLYGGSGDDIYIVTFAPGDEGLPIVDIAWEVEVGGFDPGGVDTLRTNAGRVQLVDRVENIEASFSAAGLNSQGVVAMGNALDNRITTAEGKDTLAGTWGHDTLAGGLGDDLYVLLIPFGTIAHATIEGFTPGADHIVLHNMWNGQSAPLKSLSPDRFKLIGAGGVVDRDDLVIYDVTTGALSYDTDGKFSTPAVEVALIQGNPALSAADFILAGEQWSY